MKNLYIVGARGFGRSVYNLAKESIGYLSEFDIVGFLDDDPTVLDGYKGYPPIISSVENFIPSSDDVFVCALGDVGYKKKYADIITAKGGRFINLIHRDAYISGNVEMGMGCIFSAYSRISCDVKMGDFNTFQPFVAVGHDVTIGNFCHFNTYSFMGGYVSIGDNVTLHTGAIVHPNKKVSNGSIVGAGSVVIKNVPENTTVYGNPAKTLKF